MSEHEVKTCPKPSPWSRRWRNALWICPTCQRPWVLRRTVEVAPRTHGVERPFTEYQGGPRWQWWPWFTPAASLTTSPDTPVAPLDTTGRHDR